MKWLATFTIIFGSLINALGYYPEGPILLTFGTLFWLIVGFQWKENTIIITNAVVIVVSLVGFGYHYL